MLKNDPIAALIAGAILISVVATAGICLWYLQCTRQVNILQYQTAKITRHRATMQNLAIDAVEYSRRNPAIDPILQGFGLKPAAGQNVPRR